jgi:nucleoside phosphorylase
MFIGDMGPVDAALVTQDLLVTCKPKTVVMLGIAAGIHNDVRIGDVVYAKQVDGYIESARAEATVDKENFRLAPGGSVYRCSEEFVRLLENFEFVYKDAYVLWRIQCTRDLESLTTEAERIALISADLQRDMVILDGVNMASGPILGASTAFTKWLHNRDRTLKALEMEAYGFVKAVFNRLKATSTIVLRGISDFGDERKKELDKIGKGALRRYAVRNALRLLLSLVSVGGLPKHPTRKSRKKRVGKGPSLSAALRQVHRLSSVAARDAGFIDDDPDGHPSGEIRLEQNLYVNRSIEGVIYGLFDTRPEDDPPFIVVAGEAGFGKTSLLWQIHRTMVQWDRWEPWLIKSTFLMGQSSDNARRLTEAKPNLSVEQLQQASIEAQTQSKRPVILLDTADLLLGNENDRYFLIDTLLALKENGCAIIVATRPQEAVYIRSLEDIRRVDLRDYNDEELKIAVSKHVARFYEHAGFRHLSEHVERIQKAVASGLPVHDVCKNPLTLRMLYTLYAPEAVPLEINAFKLYENFWNMRVEKDQRAGSPSMQHGSDDLTGTASAVALIMLAEGSPEIDNRLADNLLAEIGGSKRELQQLVSRGIIHQSEGRTIRFFHQTFFEHSAARSLLTRFRVGSINLLEGRMRERPNDLFVNPVFEHLLLLCESHPAPVRAKAENAFKQRKRSINPPL